MSRAAEALKVHSLNCLRLSPGPVTSDSLLPQNDFPSYLQFELLLGAYWGEFRDRWLYKPYNPYKP